MSDADRYEELRSSWGSPDEQFNWLVTQVQVHNNGESVDQYCLYMAARDMICSTLVNVAEWEEDRAIDFVSTAGALMAEIQEDPDLGEHLVLAWQPEGADEAEIFMYALHVEDES